MNGYEKLTVAICKAAISDYTKEICKKEAGKKYSVEEIKKDVDFILNSVFMVMMFDKDERLNILLRVRDKAKTGYYFNDSKEVWKKF